MSERRPRILALTVLSGALGLAPQPAAANFPAWHEFRVAHGALAGFASTGQRHVAVLPDRGFVVVWTTPNTGPSGHDVRGRRYRPDTRPAGPEFLVNTYTTGRQYGQTIAADGSGRLVVAWSSENQDGSGDGIFAQTFSATGTPVGGEFQVNVTTALSQRQPAVAMKADGAFVVAWAGPAIVIRRYDPSGAPMGGEAQVNTTPGGAFPAVDFDPAGNLVVVWEGDAGAPIRGQRFDAAGARVGSEFTVSPGGVGAARPRVGRAGDGSFVVSWSAAGPADPTGGIFARRFDAAGLPAGAEFLVNAYTSGEQRFADLEVDADGDFVLVWESGGEDANGSAVVGRRFDANGTARPAFRVNTATLGDQGEPAVARDADGNYTIAWHSPSVSGVTGLYVNRYWGSLSPIVGWVLDGSTGSTILEPNETVGLQNMWGNGSFQQFPLIDYGGTAVWSGPPGATYSLLDASATYSLPSPGYWSWCTTDCYVARVDLTGSRPSLHWDTQLTETVSPPFPITPKTWTYHVGGSFADVPPTNNFYVYVERLLHHGITGGCTGTTFCPQAATTREQMAVFILVAKEGAGYVPPPCGAPLFADVPAASPFCPWIEELARRGVVGGCGGGSFCPGATVLREQMAVFVLATVEPGFVPASCGTPMFLDVPASSPYCRWIEELARRGVIAGCGVGVYCPTSPTTREQMSVLIGQGFRLPLY